MAGQDIGIISKEKSPLIQRIEKGMAERDTPGIIFTDLRSDPNVMRKPDYFLTIFNIVPRKFQILRPPSFPLIVLAECPPSQRFKAVAKIPNIVNEKFVYQESGETMVRGILGERFATDLLCPSNLGVDIWAELSSDSQIWIDGGSDDLTKRGVFWTRNETPTEEELFKCKTKMEKFYRHLLTQAEEYARNQQFREIGFEHHLAADYFQTSTAWHQTILAPALCPNCAEPIKTGVAFHQASWGICVIDWHRTIAAGVKKREDVPMELRWWSEEEIAETKP